MSNAPVQSGERLLASAVHEIVVFQLSWLMLCLNPELPSPRFKKNCVCIPQPQQGEGGAACPFRDTDTDVPISGLIIRALTRPFFENHTRLEFEYIDADINGPTVIHASRNTHQHAYFIYYQCLKKKTTTTSS